MHSLQDSSNMKKTDNERKKEYLDLKHHEEEKKREELEKLQKNK